MPNNYSARTLLQKKIYWNFFTQTERDLGVCQLTGLRGIAATTDALLLLFQIRFTKHGLFDSLFTLLGAVI